MAAVITIGTRVMKRVKCNGHDKYAVVDTGAVVSIVSEELVKRLNLPLME